MKVQRTGPFRRAAVLCGGVVLCLASVPAALAADEEMKGKDAYTMVALWEVERPSWGDFAKMYEQYDQPIMEKLYADGLITEWGFDANLLHRPDGYTHSTWYSAPSMGALARAGEAYEKAWMAHGAEKVKQLDTQFDGMIGRHRDHVIRTEGQRSVAAKLEGGYFVGAEVTVPQDKDKQFHQFFDARMKPVYEKLLADGAIVAYGLSTDQVQTDEPGRHEWWYVTRDAGGLDAVQEAFDASWQELDEEGRRARWVSIMDVVDEDSYREWMTRIHGMQIAAH